MQDNIKQSQEVDVTCHIAKRTAKNSVFLDLFQNKSYLLKLYKTLHPEDTTATEDSLTDVTIMMGLFDSEQIIKSFIRSERHDEARETAERLIRKGKMSLEDIADCVPSLSLDELKEIEAEVMQLV